MEMLKLLAVHGRLTASEIARRLAIHQSSASRQLRSLQDAGLVYKPDFRHFAPDYGLLHLAGIAMDGFSEVGAAVKVCTRIHRDTGYGTAAAVLRHGRLIYLARLAPEPNASPVFVSDSDYPVYRSSLGLAIAYALNKGKMVGTLRTAQGGDTASTGTLREFSRVVIDGFAKHGFLYLTDFEQKKFNAASLFTTLRGPAALAVYSNTSDASPEELKPILELGVAEIEWSIAQKESEN